MSCSRSCSASESRGGAGEILPVDDVGERHLREDDPAAIHGSSGEIPEGGDRSKDLWEAIKKQEREEKKNGPPTLMKSAQNTAKNGQNP